MKDSRLARLAFELKLAIELLWLPALLARLPWRLAFRIVRASWRWDWLYREQVVASTNAAVAAGYAPDPKAFAREQRVIRLVDHVDLYLSISRGDRYARDCIDVEGAWPAGDGPVLAITMHWGVGLFGIRSLAATGRRIACLSTRFDERHVNGLRSLLRYGRKRLAEVERVAGAKLIYAGEGARPFLRALDRGESLLALIDVPPDAVGGAHPVRLLDRPAQLPAGLVKLAERTKLPVVFFTVALDFATGRRTLRIAEPFVVGEGGLDRDAAMQRLAGEIDRSIRSRPSAWMFWPVAPAFFDVHAAPVAPPDSPL